MEERTSARTVEEDALEVFKDSYMEFFERLYRGFEAEHYVAGKLFSVGYEAFKLPADFGFGLMVTNQKEQSMGPHQKGRLQEPPFAVQVKSRSLRASDFKTAARNMGFDIDLADLD
jgi:hypothetical protein